MSGHGCEGRALSVAFGAKLRQPPSGSLMRANLAPVGRHQMCQNRRYLKSVSGVSDVAIRAFELLRRQCYLKPCVRRRRRGVTDVTCANPLLAAALWPCSLARDRRVRHVYDAKPPSYLGFSELDLR